jgi:phage baseplate assembly protein W
MARIDYQTPTAKQQEYFSDFLSSFDKSPLSSDIARITNENSIKQSIRNLVLTNLGERLFNPNIGGNVSRMLFEPYTGFTADDLKKDIINTIKQNETRANDISVNVINNEDQNRFTVNIFFFIINNPNQLSLELVLQRVR